MNKLLFIFLMLSASIFAQKNINNYKYVIVPKKFDFVKKEDQYQTSSLTKFLFNKYGFTAILSDEKLPKDLFKNRCLALTGDVKNESGLFSVNTIIELRDCFNNIVLTSTKGKSKQKDYKKAYHESIRNAFKSIEAIEYNYVPFKGEEVDESVIRTNETKPKVIELKIAVENSVNETKAISLYAQSIPNGFQLVNTKPEVMFQILKTNVKDVFILKDKNGVLYKNNGIWIAEYYKESIKVIEKYEVKF
ncbi:hypothetical protein H0I31_01980 [Tenacibaculum sp. AHE15PA]|uniref:hypothetical protein n=1 Tax=unclassified Tenacibaculum TaxID=2635139 RepID=UPI001C500AF6|nr:MULTISPECIES: hypothetical protein [unclassified Tenacibaculum]QXP72494.1 hypothetical protein H0I30_07235 [Tenacibaculum sp. AHE14PA]QXP76410.1 hypothetical protein H0I31_01980 [Tenacibaculum sp. AHE15PA]